jgi:hypothetical protein
VDLQATCKTAVGFHHGVPAKLHTTSVSECKILEGFAQVFFYKKKKKKIDSVLQIILLLLWHILDYSSILKTPRGKLQRLKP